MTKEFDLMQDIMCKLREQDIIIRQLKADIQELKDRDLWVKQSDAARALNLTRDQLSNWRKSGEMLEGFHYKDETSDDCIEPRWSYNLTKLEQLKKVSKYAFRGLKSEEDKEITKVRNRVRFQIYTHLLRKTLRQKEDVTSFSDSLSNSIAESVFNNIGGYKRGYHIDHIIPVSFFDLRNEDEIIACWDLENLRYLKAEDNNKRKNKLTLEEVENFTNRQLEILKAASNKPDRWVDYLSSYV